MHIERYEHECGQLYERTTLADTYRPGQRAPDCRHCHDPMPAYDAMKRMFKYESLATFAPEPPDDPA